MNNNYKHPHRCDICEFRSKDNLLCKKHFTQFTSSTEECNEFKLKLRDPVEVNFI